MRVLTTRPFLHGPLTKLPIKARPLLFKCHNCLPVYMGLWLWPLIINLLIYSRYKRYFFQSSGFPICRYRYLTDAVLL